MILPYPSDNLFVRSQDESHDNYISVYLNNLLTILKTRVFPARQTLNNRNGLPDMKVTFDKRRTLILGILGCCMVAAFFLHFLPFFQMDLASYGIPGDPDVWYNYRQIEVMASDFPLYSWFDPMTAYPTGKHVDWGPMFPFIVSVLYLLTGVSDRVDLIVTSSLTPILIGLVMIPVVFCISRILSGWKAGIIAAIFITVISGQYYYASSFGVVDHHIAEILFTSLFCLFLLYAIRGRGTYTFDFHDPDSFVPVILPSFLAGLSLAAALLVVPTVLIFLGILAIYAIILFFWDTIRGRSSEHLLLIISIIALCSLAALALTGLPSPKYALYTYSMAQVHAFLILLAGTVLLYLYSLVSRKKPIRFLGLVVLTAIIGYAGAIAIGSDIVSMATSIMGLLFGSTSEMFSIIELEPYSLAAAWEDFNIGIILSLAGFIVLASATLKKKSEPHLFVLIWGVVIFLLMAQYMRFAYYGAVVVAIFSACTLEVILTWGNSPAAGRKAKSVRNGNQSGKSDAPTNGEWINSISLQGKGKYLVVAFIIVFCGMSISNDYSLATDYTREMQIPPPWVDTLQWIEQATPDPGMPYLGPYTADGWNYPPGAYGILSSWDYGHWITFLGKRIPVTNPFQDNTGKAYAFLFAESENTASGIAQEIGIRYVLIDRKMVDTKFQPTILLYNKSLTEHYYFENYLIPDPNGTSELLPVTLISQPYYQTVLSRLYNSDGSLSDPAQVVYIEYSPSPAEEATPVISALEQMDSDKAHQRLLQFNAAPIEGREAALHSIQLSSPVEDVSALRHFRLVYEGSGQEGGDAPYSSNTVKVFEYVKGAQLRGEGIIEVTVETNIGRVFTYRQESENGSFILPYSTFGGEYPVHTRGPYRIAGSGRTIEVSEVDVVEGNTIG